MSRNPEEIVQAAEAAYTTLDIDQMMALFDPEIVLMWNGKVAARGLDELRRWHEERHAGRERQWIRKTLRAASAAGGTKRRCVRSSMPRPPWSGPIRLVGTRSCLSCR